MLCLFGDADDEDEDELPRSADCLTADLVMMDTFQKCAC